ncbi:MAG: HDIG domain-containing protein [Phycisphaeraceae bacterium]|nr:HDIG domain-containing protein [Phycisphaeraceae bacterium]
MAKETARTPTTARTGELQRAITARSVLWPRLLRSKNFILALLIWGVFVVVAGVGAIWARSEPMVAVGRVMTITRTIRTSFDIEDAAATEQKRNAARQRARRVYSEAPGVIDQIVGSIEGLPQAIADVQRFEDIDASIRERFGLTPELVASLQSELTEPEREQRWRAQSRRLRELLVRRPFVDQQTFGLEVTAINETVELTGEGRAPIEESSQSVRNIEAADLQQQMGAIALTAAFSGPSLVVVVNRLTHEPRPTYALDLAATSRRQEEAAAAVRPEMITYPDREVIFRRGDVLSATAFDVFNKSLQMDRSSTPGAVRFLQSTAIFGVTGLVTLAIAGYTGIFCPRIRRNPTRMTAIASLMAAAALVAWWTTSNTPELVAITSLAPSLFVAIILAIAYDRRSALALGSLHGVLVCVGLDATVGSFAVIVAGIGLAMWCLREVRDRDTLIRTGIVTAVGLALAKFLVGIIETPLTGKPADSGGLLGLFEQLAADRALLQVLRDSGYAAFTGLLVASITLFILPSIERWFDITTGMTLAELRDPKNPLLRMLQQRAPGTYNHSLNLASLAEAAADAIGADSLLTYVGALYHDIGKMNKPDYFVENQTPGINKHDKLSPAMSLLIIVGHVKDGMELAREFSLPKPLWHFIESHHGTTLVEYFYHRAKKQAEREAMLVAMTGDAGGGVGGIVGSGIGPSDLEYRYPGPKPRTKEAAIIMLCDAVESASRAMADPTPARIDATVRAIATKRLMDGQFDDCDLTLRELNTIVEAVSKALAAIYHGRIAYPGGPGGMAKPRAIPTPNGGATTGLAASAAGGSAGTMLLSSRSPGNGAAPSTKLPAGAPAPEEGARPVR